MTRAHSRACTLSMLPGNSRCNSTSARQLTLLLECGADRGSVCFGDDQHPMVAGTSRPVRRIILQDYPN
jgi:hypothetical protein